MERESPKGKAVQIVNMQDNSCLSLNEAVLSKILLHPRISHMPIMLLSIVGAFRKGKSFLLNLILMHLHYKQENVMKEDWWIDKESVVEGFEWKGGVDKTTCGVLIWNEPFFVTNQEGKEVCVLLMDTQGAFDSTSSLTESTSILALSTLVSSVQLYNLMHNIQEDDLQHLRLFAEYGQLAKEEGRTPFQTLIFLVRDWQWLKNHKYGKDGGKALVKTLLKEHPTQALDARELRRGLKELFSSVGGFLMSHPGFEVATNQDFQGCIKDIKGVFLDNVKELVEDIFKPSNIVVKQISNETVTGEKLMVYFKSYMKMFKEGDIPSPLSILNATAEANNLTALAEATSLYTREMDQACGGNKLLEEPGMLCKAHEKWQHDALEVFDGKKKMGGVQLALKYRTHLKEELRIKYETYKDMFTEEDQVSVLMQKAYQLYKEEITKVINWNRPAVSPEKLQSLHQKLFDEATKKFVSHTKIGGGKFADKHVARLEDQMLTNLRFYENLNQTRQNKKSKAVTEAKVYYTLEMKKCCAEKPQRTLKDFDSAHCEYFPKAMELFDKIETSRGEDRLTHKRELEKKLLKVNELMRMSLKEDDAVEEFFKTLYDIMTFIPKTLLRIREENAINEFFRVLYDIFTFIPKALLRSKALRNIW